MAGIGQQPDLPPYITEVDAAPQSPAFPLQAYAQGPAAINPYAGAIGNNALNTPDRQAQLGQAYDQMLTKITSGPSRAEKGQDLVRNVFGGVIAPAMALFGGPGTSAAGVQMINQIKQDTHQAKMARMQEDNYARQALKGIVDISNTTSLKPLSELIKDYRKGVDQDLKSQKQTAEMGFKERMTAAAEKRVSIYDTASKKAAELKSRGLDISVDKLDEAKRAHDLADDRLRDLARLNASLRKRGQDMTNNRAAARIAADYQKFNAQAQQAVDKHNADVDAAFAKGTKDGKPFLDENGQPLDPSKYHINALPLDEPEIDNVEPDDQDFQAALSALTAPQQQAAPQAAPMQGQEQVPAAIAATKSPLVKQFGAGMEGAKAYWKSLPPDQQATQAQNFKSTFGKYPWE
jgi:hypothetical protein